jgi:four helix bundle protein
MRIERFEQIEAWKEARKLCEMLYRSCRRPPFSSDFALRDQILKAVISVMANIAEGFDRRSRNDFVRFLLIASGSLSEIKSHLYIAFDQKYVSEKEFKEIYEQATRVGKMISKFVAYLKTTIR